MGELLRSEDRVLGRFGYAKFNHTLGGDLDCFASGGIATHAGFTIDQHKLAQSRQREGILCVLVGQLGDRREDLADLLLRDVMFLSQGGFDLGF